MNSSLDKAFALIEGMLIEYDMCIEVSDKIWRVDDSAYIRLGIGIVDTVCGITDYNNKQMVFYKKIVVEKKR